MSRLLYLPMVLVVVSGFCPNECRAQTVKELSESQRRTFKETASDLQELMEKHPLRNTREWADAAVFAKGLTWALYYDRNFSSADVDLLERAIRRSKERFNALPQDYRTWANRRRKIALGYVSAVDGSVQPYGVVVPKGYDSKKPIRLDVVLHGSTRPVGMSELKFLARFDEAESESIAPDQPFIELHPLGRVENCYRWSGETDVFEAIEDVCHRYNIDRDRIVLRGMSMGASGTWHLGLKHPDRFVALGPYCGYVDTHKFSESPLPNFERVGPLPEYQELGLHMLDSVDYAANAAAVPAVACMGEKDVFFQAHVLMGEAMKREGLTLTNLISPGTGHTVDPVTHAEQMKRIAEYASGSRRPPRDLRFVTWTLKYNQCYWLEVLGLEHHYSRAELSARLRDNVLVFDEPRNITRFAIDESKLPSRPTTLRVGSSEMPFPKGSNGTTHRIVVTRRDDRWSIADGPHQSLPSGKRPGLQGPIDDAFTSPFLCVRGTGEPWNAGVQTYAQESLRRFADEWHHYFRGDLPVKNDFEVTNTDLQTRNLILFGDPGSNSWIAKVLSQLPLNWNRESLQLAGDPVSSAEHVPALIAPNPLPGAGDHYVVINSGHTFRETELAKFNYLLFPRWGDWALLKLNLKRSATGELEDNVLRAGYFDERWQSPR